MNEQIQNRVYLWDNIKYLLILFVIIGHFVNTQISNFNFAKVLIMFIYTFHMPLFLFVSGLFYNSQNAVKRSISFFMLFFVVRIVLTLLAYIFNNDVRIVLFGDDGIQWFMFALAVFILLGKVLKNYKINTYTVLILSIMIGVISGFDKTIGDKFYLSRILVFFPFYWCGIIVSSYKSYVLKLKENNFAVFIGILVVLIYIFVLSRYIDKLFMFTSYLTGRNSYAKLRYGNFGPSIRLLCYCVTTIIGISIILIIPNRKIPIISFAGTKTLQIYLWHQVIMDITKYLGIQKELGSSMVGTLLIILFSFLLSIVLSHKVFGFLTSAFSLNKLYKEDE